MAEEGALIEASQAHAQAALFDRGRIPDAPKRGTVWVRADGTMVHGRASGTFRVGCAPRSDRHRARGGVATFGAPDPGARAGYEARVRGASFDGPRADGGLKAA